MTRERSTDERISAWLLGEAPDQAPDRVLQATFQQTRDARRLRAIPGWRLFPMSHLSPAAIAVGAAAVLVLAIGAALVFRPGPSVGNVPSASPSATPTPGPTTAASPTLTPISLTGQIAFQWMVDGNMDIYLRNLDRTGLLRLTDDPASDYDPGWSPDGERIVFTRDVAGVGDLFVMNADGSGQTQLTSTPENDHNGRFSPDGGSIAYWRGDDAATALHIMDADSSNDRVILSLTNTFAGGVSWTADGQAILFNRDLSPGGGMIDIVRVEIASGDLTTLTEDSPGDDSSFDLSRDGTTIAFQSDRLPGGIFLMDVDGANVRHLTGSWTKGYPVSWSPDGDYLVYAQPDYWMHLVRIDGAEVTRWDQGGLNLAWRPAP